MLDLPIGVVGLLADVMLLVFAGYYFFRVRARERELDSRENKSDTDYHQVVDSALAKERKILDDATNEADKIISEAKYVNRSASEEVGKAMQVMVTQIQAQANESAKNFMADYEAALKQVSSHSLNEFQKTVSDLENDLRNQVKHFHDDLLPGLQKELDEYKKMRMEQSDKAVRQVVQISAQEILNKAITLDDHQELVIKSLERAKKEGVFD